MSPITRRLTVALGVAACLATACSSTAVSSATSTTTSSTTTIPGLAQPAETAAATLRANVTAVLTGYQYLLGVATSTVVTGADPAPANAALQASATDLGNLLDQAYDPARIAPIIQAWTARTQLFMTYAQNAVKGAPNDSVKTDLATNSKQLATALKAVDVNMPPIADFVTSDFSPEISATTDVIDAQVQKSPTQYGKLASAAALMPHTADVVAAAIVKQNSGSFPGTATGPAANLRAQLTAALVSHVYLVAFTTATAASGGDLSAPSQALDANTQQLGNALTALYGDATGKQFRTLWSSQGIAYASVATAGAKGDATAKSQAQSALDGFNTDFVGFLAGVLPKLDRATVTSELQSHEQNVLKVIDAQLGKDPSQFDLLRTAPQPAAGMATTWSEAIAEQFPEKYTA
jgi:hypothetical protein